MSKHNTPEARWQHRNDFKKVDPLPKETVMVNIPDNFQIKLHFNSRNGRIFTGFGADIRQCRREGRFVGPYIILKDPEHIIPII